MSPREPVKNCCLAVVSWVSWIQALLAFRALGAHPSGGSLKRRTEPFIPQGGAGNCVFVQLGLTALRVVRVSAFPTHVYVGVFPFARSAGVAQLVSEFPAEGTAPCVAVQSVHGNR